MLFARMVPTMLLGAFAGAVAAKVNRRLLILIGLAAMCLLSGRPCGPDRQWRCFLYGTWRSVQSSAACSGRSSSPCGAPCSATSPVSDASVPPWRFDSASSNFTRMIGPLLGGALYSTVGLQGVFVLGVAMYAVAIFNFATLEFREQHATEDFQREFLHQPVRGLRLYPRQPAGRGNAGHHRVRQSIRLRLCIDGARYRRAAPRTHPGRNRRADVGRGVRRTDGDRCWSPHGSVPATT